MNIIERFNNYLTEKRLSRLEVDLKMIANRYAFNPFKSNLPSSLNSNDLATNRLTENFVWHSASVKAIHEYYSNKYKGNYIEEPTYFWSKVPDKNRKIHSGIPNLISRKMATILFGSGFDIDVNVYKEGQEENNAIDEKLSKRAKDLAMEINKQVKLKEKLNKSAVSESWSGHLAVKWSHDIDLTPYPILEIADKRSFEVIKTRDITTAIVFKNYYRYKDIDYVLHEIYTTTSKDYFNREGIPVEKGTSMILNKLYMRKADGEMQEVELTTIPDTVNIQPEIIYYGLKGILAMDKPNLLGVGEFIDSMYGVSDYQGAYSIYDALDEIVSEIVAELRTNKSIRYIPDVFLPIDEDGNIMEFDDFVTNYVKTNDKKINNENHDPQITTSQISDKTQAHYEKYKVFVGSACNMSGLAPIALGVTGLEAINSSDKSTREKNKTTLETREMKLELWKPFLEELILKQMQLASWIQKTFPESVLPGIPLIDIDYGNCDVSVVFNDYINDSIEDKVRTWSAAKSGGVASTDMAVKKIHGEDLSESDVIDEVNRIKFEQGILTNSPGALMGLTGEEDITTIVQEQNQEVPTT